jgi:ABC-type lipoprotein export system ATPase subunit
VTAATAAPVDVTDVFQVYPTADGGVAALRGLTLTVGAAEIVAVYGPSGSGKSTFMRLLAGLETPAAGIVRVLGSDTGALSDRDRSTLRSTRIGFVDQHYDRALPPDLPLRRIVSLQSLLGGSATALADDVACSLLATVGLADRVDARPLQLSGGERQRAAVAAALAHEPRLVLADEPAGELDADNAHIIYQLLRSAARDSGAAVVVVTHDPVAAGHADRVVRLRDGRISEEDDELVVDDAGWVRIPPNLRVSAGLGRRTAASVKGNVVELRSSTGPSPRPREVVGAESGARHGPVVQLANLTKAYADGGARRGIFAGLELSFAPATLTAVVGRSGSGKSTLLRILAGLERSDDGAILVADDDLTAIGRAGLAAERRSRLAVVLQNPHLVDYLSALENVALGLSIRGVQQRDAMDTAERWLRRLALGDRLRLPTSSLSGGERQRVAIARALASGADVLLLDEPTSRLDEQAAAVVSACLREAARAGGTVICATHEPILISYADRTVDLAAATPDIVAPAGADGAGASGP